MFKFRSAHEHFYGFIITFWMTWSHLTVACCNNSQIITVQIVERSLAMPVYTVPIPGVAHIFAIVWIFIPACLIEQPNSLRSRMYVHAYMKVTWVALSVYSEAWMVGIKFGMHFPLCLLAYKIFQLPLTGAWALLVSQRFKKFKFQKKRHLGYFFL